SLKGKLKIAGGATAHSRTVAFKLTSVSNPGSIQYPDGSDSDFSSTVTCQSKVAISGLGFGYSFAQTHPIRGRNWFGIQQAPNTDGLKALPNNAGYYEISYPKGYEVVPVY